MGARTVRFLFLNVGHFYDHLFMLLFPTVVLAVGRDIPGTYGELLGLSVYGFVLFGAAAVPAGWLGDRWSRRGMMAVFFVGIGFSAVLTGLAGGPIGLALGLTAIGLFAAIYHPVGIAMVAENARRLGVEMGINGVFGNLGVASAALVAGLLIDLMGWRWAFIVPGAAAIATGAAFLLVRDGAPAPAAAVAKAAAHAVDAREQVRVFAVLVFATLCGGVIFNATTVGLPKVFAERLGDLAGSASGVGGWAFAVFALAAVAQVVVGFLIDRYPLKPVFVAVTLAQPLLLSVAATASGPTMVAVAIGIMLLVFGLLPVQDTIVARYTTAAWRSRVYGVKYLLSLGVSAVAVPLVAGLHQWGGGFRSLFLVLAALAVGVLAAAALMPGRRVVPRLA
jgi:MFS family permease